MMTGLLLHRKGKYKTLKFLLLLSALLLGVGLLILVR
jgi:hypothetical protein